MIEFKNVSKVYPNGAVALKNVSIKIDKGEFVFIVGSSGAGKSTFLKLIMCEEAPESGEIIFNGRNLSNIHKKQVPFIRRSMGIVFQDFRLIDHMTVYDNIAFAMHVVGANNKEIKKRVPYICGLVGLEKKMNCKPHELSGGEQQRVGLARALVNNPQMIIADEPTGNVDPDLSFEIVDLLSEINRRGTTVLMVTHEHDLVQHFHKRVIEINGGVVVADTNEKNKPQPHVRVAPLEQKTIQQSIESEFVETEPVSLESAVSGAVSDDLQVSADDGQRASWEDQIDDSDADYRELLKKYSFIERQDETQATASQDTDDAQIDTGSEMAAFEETTDASETADDTDAENAAVHGYVVHIETTSGANNDEHDVIPKDTETNDTGTDIAEIGQPVTHYQDELRQLELNLKSETKEADEDKEMVKG